MYGKRPTTAPVPSSRTVRTKASEKVEKLWDEWAAENLGSTTKQDDKRYARLVRECTKLTATVDERLRSSAQIRASTDEQRRPKSTATVVQSRLTTSAASATSHSDEQPSKQNLLHETQPRRKATTENNEPGRRNSHQNAGSEHRARLEATESLVAELRAEVEALRGHCRHAKLELDEQRGVEAELRSTIELLYNRVHAQDQQEVELRRRLAQHAKLEPIMNRLAGVFTFTSAEAVVQRLEVLENAEMRTLQALSEVQEDNLRLQRQLEAARTAADEQRLRNHTEHVTKLQQLQMQNESLKAEVEAERRRSGQLAERQQAYLQLQTAVLDLHDCCIKAANLERNGEELTKFEPLVMVAAVREMMIMNHPTLAGRHLADLQKLANRMWLQHFNDKPDLKGRVLETLEQLGRSLDAAQAADKQARLIAKQSQHREKEALSRARKLERENEDLQTELRRVEILSTYR